MEFLEAIKARIPDYAKDIRLNLDGTLLRTSLEASDALAVALAAAFAAKSPFLADAVRRSGLLPTDQANAALAAAALMGMNNIWYPYVEMTGDPQIRSLPAQLRMNAYANHGGVSKRQFEMYALAASIIGKCQFCVSSHYELLKKEGMDLSQLRDVGRIASVINATAQILVAEGAA